MVDRVARDRMVAAIQNFLEEKITAFQFDEALDKANEVTKDKTVHELRFALWFFYDDITDHLIRGNKTAWDALCRIQLLLKSDSEITYGRRVCRWRLRHAIAAILFALFLVLAWKVGWGTQLFLLAIPFGFASILLAKWRRATEPPPVPAEIRLAPFPTMASLWEVRRRTTFSKKPYPAALQGRTIRTPLSNRLAQTRTNFGWLLFGPLILLFQMLPEQKRPILLKTPNASA